MNKKVRFVIYLCLIIYLSFLGFKELGFFDNKTTKIDEFIIKKPTFFRNDNHNRIIDKDSAFVYFKSFYNKRGPNYFIQKINNKDIFINILKTDLNINEEKLISCYIINYDEDVDFKNNETNILIYRYPYFISFIELNKYRTKEIIGQVCRNYITKFRKRGQAPFP